MSHYRLEANAIKRDSSIFHLLAVVLLVVLFVGWHAALAYSSLHLCIAEQKTYDGDIDMDCSKEQQQDRWKTVRVCKDSRATGVVSDASQPDMHYAYYLRQCK